MKFCDVTDAYHATSGGIRTYLDAKIRFLRERTDGEHALVVPADRDFTDVRGRTRVIGIASPVIPGCAPYRVLLRHGALTAALDAFGPDVIELGNPYLQPRAARGWPRRYRAFTAGFYHTDFPRAYVETPLARVAGPRVARRVAAGALRYAAFAHARLDLTLVSSPAMRDRLAAAGVCRVEVLPLGVDTEIFHPRRRDPRWREELGAGENDLVLVFAGRLDAEKRIDVLVETVRRLPEALRPRLVLMGQGPQRARWERAAAAEPRLTVRAFEPDRARLARALASADVYVSAARHETFGLAVVEAQACGLPVVGPQAGAMTDRVPEDCGILVDGLDPAALARAVERAHAGRRAMGEAARRRVEAEYGWERTFTQLFQWYEAGLRAPREGGRVARLA